MTMVPTPPRPGVLSIAMIGTSMTMAIGISLAMDVVLLTDASAVSATIAVGAIRVRRREATP